MGDLMNSFGEYAECGSCHERTLLVTINTVGAAVICTTCGFGSWDDDVDDIELPPRVQQSRLAGWRKPAGAIAVGRGTRWGNPHRIIRAATQFEVWREFEEGRRRTGSYLSYDAAARAAVAAYSEDLSAGRLLVSVEDVRRHLAGRTLMCWCSLAAPCHADLLITIANPHG